MLDLRITQLLPLGSQIEETAFTKLSASRRHPRPSLKRIKRIGAAIDELYRYKREKAPPLSVWCFFFFCVCLRKILRADYVIDTFRGLV